MNHWKKIVSAALWPPVWVVCLASLSFLGIIWVLADGHQTQWFAYPLYVLSAYALAVVCVRLVPWTAKKVQQRKQLRRQEESASKENRIRELGKDLKKDLLVNLAFGLFYITSGVKDSSVWLVTNGVYNIVQGLAYGQLIRFQRKLSVSYESRRAWRGYVLMGCWLLAVNLTMTGCVFLVIWRGQTESYEGLLVFAMAALTFYKLGFSIADLIRYRNNDSPILGAACNAGHTEAIMSLFMLQTALFHAFGQDFSHQKLMNTLTGTGVCLLTVLGALGMILYGRKKIREQ